jgi:hypothetical protein
LIVADRNSEHYRKNAHDKWKAVAPEINLEDALHCEDLFIDYVNGKTIYDIARKEINVFLIDKGLIKLKNENDGKED